MDKVKYGREIEFTSANVESRKEKASEDNNDKTSLIIDALNETIAEYNSRSREICETLSSLDIDPKSMPKHVEDSWCKVSAILRTQGLSDVDTDLLRIHMEEEKRNLLKKAREERILKSRYRETCRCHGTVLEKQEKAREATEAFQKVVETQWLNNEEEYVNRMFTATKLNEYRQFAMKLENDLEQQLTSDRSPDKILEKYEDYLELVERFNSLDKELEKYGDLPANLSEARIMLEEKQEYLKNIERELFEKMKV